MKNLPTVQELLTIGEVVTGNGIGKLLSGEVIKMTDKAIFVHFRWEWINPYCGQSLDKEYYYEVWVPKSALEVYKLKCEGNHYMIKIKNWFMKNGFQAREIRKSKRA